MTATYSFRISDFGFRIFGIRRSPFLPFFRSPFLFSGDAEEQSAQ
jgi:hypothetical protein